MVFKTKIMENFKGTKGEWETRFGQICSAIYCGDTQLALRASSKEEAKANIILMAHAPEMLEMLKRCENWVLGCNQYSPFVKEIQELIKKATTI